MMETVFPFALLCFTSLFTITSPLSTMPVFLTMTQSLDEKERRAVAIRATLVACCALLLFVLAGQFLFKFFGISTNGFRIVGGIIIFRRGYYGVKQSRNKSKEIHVIALIHRYFIDLISFIFLTVKNLFLVHFCCTFVTRNKIIFITLTSEKPECRHKIETNKSI